MERGFVLKHFRRFPSNRGFTLPEVLIVIVIIGILVAIAIPVYSDIADTSRKTVCKYNASYIARVLSLDLYRYEPEDRFEPRNSTAQFDYSETSLNNYLEKELENYQANSNKDRIMNPISRSKVILHNSTPVSGSISDGRNPAVFITGNSSYSYTGGGSTDDLEGSIVVYFNDSSPYNIQIYYLDKEGSKVELLLNYN